MNYNLYNNYSYNKIYNCIYFIIDNMKKFFEKDIVKIIKYLDYCYLDNYIINSLYNKSQKNDMNEWEIFSIYSFADIYNNEQYNILYLIKNLISQDEFDDEIFLWSIDIFKKICIKYADVIDNYIYLFGAIYITTNFINDYYLSEKYLVKLLKIEINLIKKMIHCINKYMDYNDIYFGDEERKEIIDSINTI